MTKAEFLRYYREKRYIGDSVYAHFDGMHIVLETRNNLPDDPSNIIYLNTDVFHNLSEFYNALIRDANKIEKEIPKNENII